MIDLSGYKKLTIGGVELKKLAVNGVDVWTSHEYTNWVPLSTDTDGSIYNGVGYKNNVRLSSSGGISSSAQNGSTTTGFIPINGAVDVVRLKGVQWLNVPTDGHHYFNYYDSNKKFLGYMSSGMYDHGANYSHIFTVTRDANGVETMAWNNNYGTTNSLLQCVRSASYVRITAKGDGANMIVTINEEIT